MATQYSVTISLDNDTLAWLKGKSLRVFKGVLTGSAGLPVVWFSQNTFSQQLTFSWEETYGGYVTDAGKPVSGFSVLDVSSSSMSLGQKLTANNDGSTNVTNDGEPGMITVMAAVDDTRDWTGGMGQVVNDKLSPICAFDIGGSGSAIVMEPYERLVLVFESTAAVNTGTVIAAAISSSITIELDGSDTSRTVSFSKDGGWSGNTGGWATINLPDLDLAKALIMSQPATH